ncbi:MAG: hypothetical protein M1827_006200 [Pycnora praestabilis]|nr:MAG: hypothetical protein M1827_006200 [Pycnora praestabilis]
MATLPTPPIRPVRPPTQLIAQSAAPLGTRAAACTHIKMTRVYGHFKCDLCKSFPSLGFVYRCTQDCEMSTPLADRVGVLLNDLKGKTIPPDKTTTDSVELSGWIARDIEKGLYSPEQIEKLKAQKLKVNKTIAAITEGLDDEDITFPSPPTSSTLLNESDPLEIFYAINEATKPLPGLSAVAKSSKTRSIQDCQWQCCFTCRPISRDRCFVSVDLAFNSDAEQGAPLAWGHNYRPIADVVMMRTIGLCQPRHSPISPATDQYCTESDSSSDGELIRATDGTKDEMVNSSNKSFRSSVKRAFKGMLKNRRQEGSTPSSISENSRTANKFYTAEEDPEEFDIGLWRTLNEELLQDASTIMLPSDEESEVNFGDGEVEVNGGVAVTEEGIVMGTADIIMQV